MYEDNDHKVHLGYDNWVPAARVVAVLMPPSMPVKRLRRRAEAEGRLLDVTNGRRTRALVVTDSNHVILTAVHPETLWKRFGGVREEEI